MGNRAFEVGIQKDAVVGEGVDAGQLVRDDDDGRLRALADVQNQAVELDRADGVQTGRGLVQKQQVRAGHDGAGQAHTLFHAAAQVGWQAVSRLGHAHPFQRLQGTCLVLVFGQGALHLQGQHHVLEHRHGGPQRGALEQHANVGPQLIARGLVAGPVVLLAVQHLPCGGLQQADQALEQGALAATAAAHHRVDGARLDVKVDALLDQGGAVLQPQVTHAEQAHLRSPARRRTRQTRHRARSRRRCLRPRRGWWPSRRRPHCAAHTDHESRPPVTPAGQRPCF